MGIGGIGMSALARICLARGYSVQGSDIGSYGATALIACGARVFQGHEGERLDASVSAVVVSSAISRENPEWQEAMSLGIPVYHRSVFLRKLVSPHKTIAISGAHGKTTTTSLMGWLLDRAGYDPLIICGGIMNNYGSNVRCGNGEWAIVEADESDCSHLNFDALEISVALNVEPEHMETYGTFDTLLKTFVQFIQKPVRTSVVCMDDPGIQSVVRAAGDDHAPILSYGIQGKADVTAQNISFSQKGAEFDVIFSNGERWERVFLALFGRHQILNALAVVSVARSLGICEAMVRDAFGTFLGVSRRMTVTGYEAGITFIDDYAHHPTEIHAVLSALREIFPDKQIFALCQPHRYSRLRDCFDDFATCFSAADRAFIFPVYSAGETPIPGINSETLCAQARSLGHKVTFMDACMTDVDKIHDVIRVLASSGGIVICLGAGDITKLAHALPNALARYMLPASVSF